MWQAARGSRTYAQAKSERRETGRSHRCRRCPASPPPGRRVASLSKLQNRDERGTSDEFRDVLGRETITRIEYAWSGDVLTTLLPYLDEQGIDLLHSDHDEVASTLSHAREGSVFVLTSDHRERYVARLDPSQFDGAVLRRYYEEFNETAAEGVDYAMLDGIAFVRDTLTPLESAIVAVVVIG